ncbi:MAG: AIR synthase related protein [Thermoplasmata archaeon]
MYSLDEIAKEVRGHRGVRRKKDIGRIVNLFSNDALASFGEDCAVIKNGKKVILFACDGIIDTIVKRDPYLAGYFSILVNANDIASMGGKSLAAVNVVSYRNSRVLNRMLEGLADGSKKFGVQIVGGHSHPYCKYDSVSVSIFGEARL